jgi:hypothetical protein
MIESLSSTNAEPTLPEMLASRARSSSDGRLVADVIFGSVFATAALLWRPGAWVVFVSASCCFAAFGAWGIADRILGEQDKAARWTHLLRAGRATAVVTGTIAALALLFSLWGLALGTWIS